MDPKSRPAAAGQLIYEDIEPQYQWVSGKDADTLIVDLTRIKDEAKFKKEHLKVKIDNRGNLKVSGERPLQAPAGNRWRRFQKVFRLAEDCNTGEIKAKFDNGVLSVVMPKLIREPPSSPPSAAAQTPSATPAVPPPPPPPSPPVKPEPTSRKAPEEEKTQVPAPAPPRVGKPSAEGEGPRRTGMRRRPRWVAVAVVAVVAVVVGLGFYYYWSCSKGASPDEQQQLQMEGFREY